MKRGIRMKVVVSKTGDRLDSYLANELGISRTKVQKLIKNNLVFVNDEVESSSYKVVLNDEIEVEELEEEINIEKENIPLNIIYEDEYLMVINKKSGMVVHPAVGNYNHTLVNALMYYLNLDTKNNIRPGIVHRLDKDTSGLMLVAKTEEALEKLSLMIKNKEVTRVYLALVWGIIKHEKGTIDAPIGRDINNRQKYVVTNLNSKDSITHFKVLERYSDATLIECILETGRTHQIRVHMNYIGHPVVNDPVYGNRKLFDNSGQMLHSKYIKFVHPFTGKELSFEVEPDEKFNNLLKKFKDS
jgi:23S rRNA pseudouridine1911/1915/1917 synthase